MNKQNVYHISDCPQTSSSTLFGRLNSGRPTFLPTSHAKLMWSAKYLENNKPKINQHRNFVLCDRLFSSVASCIGTQNSEILILVRAMGETPCWKAAVEYFLTVLIVLFQYFVVGIICVSSFGCLRSLQNRRNIGLRY